MNRVDLVGRTTRDIELKYTNSGKAVARVTLAVDRHDKQNGCDFIPCIVWDKAAENMSKYIRKGDRVGISGRIQTGSYTDKDGRKVYTTDVVADFVEFLNNKQEQPEPSKPELAAGFTKEEQEALPFV